MRFIFLISILFSFSQLTEAQPQRKVLLKKMRVNDETTLSEAPSNQSDVISAGTLLAGKAKKKPSTFAHTAITDLKISKTPELDDNHQEPRSQGTLAKNLRDKVMEGALAGSASQSGSSEGYLTDSDLSDSHSSPKEAGRMSSKLRGKMHSDADVTPANESTKSILESIPSKITKKQKQTFEEYAKILQEHHNSRQILAAYNGLKTEDMSAGGLLKLIKTLIDTDVTNYPMLLALHAELAQGLGGDFSTNMLNVLSGGFLQNANFDIIAFKNTYNGLVVDGMRPLSKVAIAAQLMNAKKENYPAIVATYKKFIDRALLQKIYRAMLVEALVSMDTKHYDDFYNAYASIVSKQMTQEQRAEIFINLAENVQGELYQKFKNIHSEMQYKGVKADERYAMFEGLLILNPNVTAWEHFRDNVDQDLDASGIVDVAKRLKVALKQKPPLAKKPQK